MEKYGSSILLDSEGKGFIGCMIAIILIAVMIFVGVKLGPVYYANYMFEDDLKAITSEAGARFMNKDEIIRNVLSAAKERKVRMTPEDAEKNVTIERYAGQIHIGVQYFVPVDFIIFKKDLRFEIKNSSFTAS